MTAADPERWKFCGHAFAAERYGVVPDMICFAKGVTNGAAPLGGVLVQGRIHEAFMQGPEHVPELAHGFTYSGHPLGVAAANASLDLYRDEGLFERGRALEPVLADAVHALKDAPYVVDIRTIGVAAGIDLAPIHASPGLRGARAFNWRSSRRIWSFGQPATPSRSRWP